DGRHDPTAFPTRRSSDLLLAARLDAFSAAPRPVIKASGPRRTRASSWRALGTAHAGLVDASGGWGRPVYSAAVCCVAVDGVSNRSEEHTSELQSPCNLVC